MSSEAYLYRNPEQPLSDFLRGGFAVYDQAQTTVTQGELVELQAQAVSRFSGNLSLILPEPEYKPGETTAVATMLIPKLGGRDFDILPVGFGSIVTNSGPSRLVSQTKDHELTKLYVIPETSDGFKLEKRGIASAILHKLIEDLGDDERVFVKNFPDFGHNQTDRLIQNMIKMRLIDKHRHVKKYTGATQFTVKKGGNSVAVVSSMLEIYKPWLKDRTLLADEIDALEASFSNTDLPENVVDLSEYRRKKKIA